MKFNMRNLFMGIVLIIVLVVVFMRGDQLVELGETMSQGSLLPLLAAIATQLGKYVAQSFGYVFSFEAVGEKMAPKETLPLVFGTFFMNTIAPSLNLAGTTLVVDDARRRGIPTGKATGAALLMQITIDGAFSTVMVLAFILLACTVGLSPVWLVMGLIVILLVGGMITLLLLGRKKPGMLKGILTPIEGFVNRVLYVFKHAPLNPWADKIIGTFSESAKLIWENPKSAAKAYGCSMCASLCELSCFALVGLGFGVTGAEALVCGYVVATLFAMISFTPQGVGLVEAAVVVAFTSYGESAAAGTAIGLVYRGIVFWMPFIIGAILINTTKAFKGDVKAAAVAQDREGAVDGTVAVARHLDNQKQYEKLFTDESQPVYSRDEVQAALSGQGQPSHARDSLAASPAPAQGVEAEDGLAQVAQMPDEAEEVEEKPAQVAQTPADSAESETDRGGAFCASAVQTPADSAGHETPASPEEGSQEVQGASEDNL